MISQVTGTVLDASNSGTLPVLVGTLGAGIGGLATYLAARYRGSGGVRTSDAEDLWDAAEGIRKDQAEEVRSLRSDNVALRTDNANLRTENRELRKRLERLEKP